MEQLQYLLERLENLDEKFSGKLDDILVQTTRTNGRVTAIEKTIGYQGIDIESAKKQLDLTKEGIM